jgi:hypothetical protein
MKITSEHRKKLTYYLTNFYDHFPHEKFTIFHCVRYFKERQKMNKDAWCGVCGDTGVGKSLFVLMAMILQGRKMDLTDNIAYIPTGNQIMEMFDKLSRQCLLVDEAAREMRAVNWQSKQQQGVNTRAMTDRFKNNWVFLNMPNFNEFTKSMRRGNLQFRFIIPYRTNTYARVILQRKSRNWRDPDPWQDDYAMEVYKKVESRYKGISNDQIDKIERNLSVNVMDFIVPNLEYILPEIIREYEKNKLASRQQAQVEGTKEDKAKKARQDLYDFKHRIAHLIFYNKLKIGLVKLSQKEIADNLGLSPDTLKKLLNTPLLPKDEASLSVSFRAKGKTKKKDVEKDEINYFEETTEEDYVNNVAKSED